MANNHAVVLRQEKHLVGGSCILVWWCSPGVRQNIQNILRVRSKIHHLDFYTTKWVPVVACATEYHTLAGFLVKMFFLPCSCKRLGSVTRWVSGNCWGFNPFTPKISLVILLTVCHKIYVMLVWRIWNWIDQ